ncbi:MAG: 1-acyl-sn-glycerol-3-phosphate acyltransferase, partial [Moorea sp. SIO2B7]|nr:1-acyl-sn-glycerol-3-phosphate acyltransferase [Moorena sp. SIO2B7]
PPAFNSTVLRIVRGLLPWWLRSQVGITEIKTNNVEVLADLYSQFNQGKTRFLIAFRHPSTNDPFCLANLLWNSVPQAAKKQGITLKYPVHSHFIYDRGIPIWAGSLVGWLFSQLGGISIQRGKLDRAGLRSARDLMANGKLPMAASPEGGTNGHSEIISPLEPGISQIGFWCLEDLQTAGRSEQVVIVPLGIQYSYVDPPWTQLEQLLSKLEADVGIEPPKSQEKLSETEINDHKQLYLRLLRLGERLLSLMEKFYSEFYYQSLPSVPSSEDPNEEIKARLEALLELALKVSEQHFKVKPKGSFIDRCRRLEQAGWNRIYRQDYNSLSPVEYGLGNWVAAQASLYMGHMRMVEQFSAVTGKYVLEKPTAERFAETLLIVSKVVNYLKGGSRTKLPRLGKQRIEMTVGQPISLSERWEAYQTSRRQAVADLTQDLQNALENLIK